MATTLVGIFDSTAQAERAREQLQQQGVPRESIHITDNQSLNARTTTTTETLHRGFFARLFGLDDDHPHVDQYSQTMRSGAAMLTVTVEDRSQCGRIQSLLEQAGALDVDERSRMAQGQTDRGGDTLKVMEEKLDVGKRVVDKGGVRVRQYVTERPVHEQIELCEERAIVERRPVDRAASPGEIDTLSMKDRELEIHERAEQAVVGKTARVVEEVRVGKEATTRTEEIDDTVRRTDVDIEQLDAARQPPRQRGGDMRNNPPR